MAAPRAVPTRRFGAGPVELSALAFGSMRLPPDADDATLTGLLVECLDAGVTTMHSSSEYDTFPRFTRLLASACRTRPDVGVQHVVKLAAPHFGEPGFSAADLEQKVAAYRDALRADQLDVVQWMLRFDLQQEARRRQMLADDAARIGDAVAALQARGWLRAFACFPYTRGFADDVLGQPWCAGLVDYLNLVELASVPLLERLGRDEHGRRGGFVALRPLAAKRVLSLADEPARRAALAAAAGCDDLVATALRFPLWHPVVASTVLSVSTSTQLATADAAVHGITNDPARFQAVISALSDPAPC
jgi:aryl-alcohol dehydrogenase-like predicted oxidoreductase